jgi:hypothetical protein
MTTDRPFYDAIRRDLKSEYVRGYLESIREAIVNGRAAEVVDAIRDDCAAWDEYLATLNDISAINADIEAFEVLAESYTDEQVLARLASVRREQSERQSEA